MAVTRPEFEALIEKRRLQKRRAEDGVAAAGASSRRCSRTAPRRRTPRKKTSRRPSPTPAQPPANYIARPPRRLPPPKPEDKVLLQTVDRAALLRRVREPAARGRHVPLADFRLLVDLPSRAASLTASARCLNSGPMRALHSLSLRRADQEQGCPRPRCAPPRGNGSPVASRAANDVCDFEALCVAEVLTTGRIFGGRCAGRILPRGRGGRIPDRAARAVASLRGAATPPSRRN